MIRSWLCDAGDAFFLVVKDDERPDYFVQYPQPTQYANQRFVEVRMGPLYRAQPAGIAVEFDSAMQCWRHHLYSFWQANVLEARDLPEGQYY